jgi:exodeoxyribonuclease V beta subunit
VTTADPPRAGSPARLFDPGHGRPDARGGHDGPGEPADPAGPDDGAEPPPFDVCGPLPRGLTLLEASAGTGKTFTIAALAARFVAEGLPLDQLLIVTFTKMATGELRERVRERLVSATDALRRALNGGRTDPSDEVATLLAAGPPEVVAQRHRRLAAAVSGFDSATIATTHGFCLQVLASLGVASDVEQDVVLVEDPSDLVDQVVDDLYVRHFAHPTNDDPLIPTKAARTIGRTVLAQPETVIVPPFSWATDQPALRRRLAEGVRLEYDRRKRAMGILTYDDVLVRLRDTLVRGPGAGARLRQRFSVVLVDEMQDTDSVQWEILRLAFDHQDSTLVLIGDPKQAIYAFRGADVFAYLKAAARAGSKATLSVNWRSDGPLLEAFDALFDGAQLGHPGITYRRVRPAEANQAARLRGAPHPEPLRVRVLHRSDQLVPLTRNGQAQTGATRRYVAEDLAADVVELLGSGAEILDRRPDGTEGPEEPVRPGHLAVLVRRNVDAQTVCDELHRVGVPAVLGGSGSVFGTTAAREWVRLFEALERPTSRERAAGAALTRFVGWDARTVGTADDDRWEALHGSLHRWAAVLRRRGVAALLEHLTTTQGIPARVLAEPSGERFLTDLRHVGQLLHAAAVTEGLGTSALGAWLRRRIEEGDDEAQSEDRTRRLESDAEAVQVLTIHRSKGLEFPIVYCPFVWDARLAKDEVPIFHDPDNHHARTIDVGMAGGGDDEFAHHQQLAQTESQGEQLRMLYVALTRAKHQVVTWWAAANDARDSALGRLLFARGRNGVVASVGTRRVPEDDDVVERLTRLGPQVGVERMAPRPPVRWAGSAPDLTATDLEAATFSRSLDLRWRRVSYTSLTQAAHDQSVGTESDEEALSDEAIARPAAARRPDPASALAETALLLGPMPANARVGTFVHRVLETVDFSQDDLAGGLAAAVEEGRRFQQLDLGDPAALVDGLATAITAPLGPAVGGWRLADIGRKHRLDELGFELPIAGGDRPTGELVMADLAAVLRNHLAPDDPLVDYAGRLEDPLLAGPVRGFLTGSLDLVFRLPDQRYVVVDYKTNRLGPPDQALTAWHYRPEALRAAMSAAHYPLQALLYLVALHRYLRWRVADYDPARHLGGALYLFLRGMSSPDRPSVDGQPCGVWSWLPPVGLVPELSDLFDRGQTGAANGRGRRR